MENTANTTPWGTGRKVLFRFFFVYFLMYCFFNFMDMTSLWSVPITWLGRKMHLFKAIPALPNGSGDTTYNYLQLLCYLVIAFTVCIIWSLLDRKRPGYEKLRYWFFVMLRYVLGLFMLTYGFAKIFKSQFPFPYPSRLLEPIGEQSPMGLAWTFMGYSIGFNLFTGLAEALGGLFLMFRRTTTFGALFSMTVLTNIVAMNFFYDIPVKLFSAHLLLMAIIIALPDAKRLIDFFFLDKAVPAPSFYRPIYGKKWMRISRVVLRIIIIAGLTGLMTYEGIIDAKEYGDYAPKSSLAGVYNVEEFSLNGAIVPPLITDSTRWRYFIINDNQYASAKTMTDKLIYYDMKLDTVKKTILLKDKDEKEVGTLSYSVPDTAHMIVTGMLEKDSLHITFKRKAMKDFRLVGRGIHWVNEYPFNR